MSKANAIMKRNGREIFLAKNAKFSLETLAIEQMVNRANGHRANGNRADVVAPKKLITED